MNKKRIYIAGKVSGLPWIECSFKFGKHQQKLLTQGHEPVVPLDLCDKDDEWPIAMRKCIAALVTCEEIHCLHDWRDSPGAIIEHQLAKDLKMPIFYINK